MAVEIQYLHDTVLVKSNCFYKKNDKRLETDLPSVVNVFEETRFFRVALAQSEVQIQESLLETRFLADQVNVSSEITSGLGATKECVVKIQEVLGAPLISMDVLESVVQIQESLSGRITEVGLNSEVQVQESLSLKSQQAIANSEIQIQESLSLISEGREPLPFKKVTPPTTNWNKQ